MILITMAGLSKRFTDAGYDRPKYMLPLGGRSLFEHSVGSFARYFDSVPFAFVLRDVQGTHAFVAETTAAMGVKTSTVITLDAPTVGQAQTAALGLRQAGFDPNLPTTIFNIDTFRPDFVFPQRQLDQDGYLEVFRGSGDNWSFARTAPDDPERVVETTEKRPISDLCSTGLYHFARAGDFLDAYDQALAGVETGDAGDLLGPRGELYVAPLYNHLIARDRRIGVDIVPRESVIFCGVPAEYTDLLADPAYG